MVYQMRNIPQQKRTKYDLSRLKQGTIFKKSNSANCNSFHGERDRESKVVNQYAGTTMRDGN